MMSLLEEKIRAEIEWRIGEIATLKVLPFHAHLSEEQQRVIKKYTIPAFCTLWEGFVQEAFSIYIDEINALQLPMEKMASALLAHSLDVNYLKNNRYLGDSSEDFQLRIKKIAHFSYHFRATVQSGIAPISKLPLESNVNYATVTEMLIRLNLSPLPEYFADSLNKLLNFKQKVAYGDVHFPLKQQDIDEFSHLVLTLMDEILLRIIEGYENKTYLSKECAINR